MILLDWGPNHNFRALTYFLEERPLASGLRWRLNHQTQRRRGRMAVRIGFVALPSLSSETYVQARKCDKAY
jgi:hypothetical protein